MDFVAEIGLNYNGNLNLAFEMIRQAKLCGANVAKFQLGWRSAEGDLNHLTIQDIHEIKEYCGHIGIELMFSIITDEALQMIEGINFDRLKIASRTVVDNPNLCKEILNKGKETYVSLGMWDSSNLPFSEYTNVNYLWCKSKYPTRKPDMVSFPVEFSKNKYYGYSDHSLGISYCLMAISRGAKYIEKHFTLNKSNNSIRDHVLSADPNEFRLLVDLGREISLNI